MCVLWVHGRAYTVVWIPLYGFAMQVNDFMSPTSRKAFHDGDGYPMGVSAGQCETSALDSGQGRYKCLMHGCHPDGDYSVVWGMRCDYFISCFCPFSGM